jgi:folate-dependent phosphoribosylglycinamide formyltransferase PurN
MTRLKMLHDPASGPMRLVGFMSGSGSNLEKILGHEGRLASERGASPFAIVAIFTDNPGSRAVEIGAAHNLPVVVRDIGAFYAARGLPKKDLSVRPEFDAGTVEALKVHGARFAAFAGYMSVASPVLINAFTAVNVHPADLSVELPDGRRRWTGGRAVLDAIAAGESVVRSTTHIVEETVDGGRILMISAPMRLEYPPGADPGTKEGRRAAESHNQNRLKEAGDWVVFPRTLEYIADGRFAADEWGALYFDGAHVPKGLRLEK